MLKTKVIASSIANLTDARYFAAWGVDAMGFNLNLGEPDSISAASALAIKEWVSGPLFIGEFNGLQSKEEIDTLISELNLDAVQLGPFAPKDWAFEIPVYRTLLQVETSTYTEGPIILKSETPLSSQQIISLLEQLPENHLTYIDFPLNTEDLLSIIQENLIEGIVLKGGAEEKVGFKSFDELDEIMEALELE